MERAQVADYLIGTDQKIPDWSIKTMFLGEVETAIRLDTESRLISWALSWMTSFRACSFLFNMKTEIGKKKNQNRNRYMEPKKGEKKTQKGKGGDWDLVI